MKQIHVYIIQLFFFSTLLLHSSYVFSEEKDSLMESHSTSFYYDYNKFSYLARDQVYLIGYNIGFPLIQKQIRINPCELYFGMISKVGFYVKLKTNFNFNSRYKKPLSFTPDFKDIEKTKHQRFGVLAGVYMQLAEPFYLYFGIGYGLRKQMLTVNCMNDEKGLYNEYYYYNRYRSVELEAGTTFRFQMITFSVGAAMLPIGNKSPYFELNAGLGVALSTGRF